jgi:hypothetical protein
VANPGLTISYTPRVLPSGLDDNGIGVLASAKRDGFNPDVVNVRAMNYGASVDNGGNGAGRTGGALEHSAAGAALAASNAYIARWSMCSVGRDNGSCASSAAAVPTCSGIAQSPYAFSAIFEGR